MSADITAAFDKKEFPALEPGAMCYMLSKQGYLNDSGGHWHPHLMFFIPLTDPASWGTGLPGSPVVVAFTDTPERHTVFLVTVSKWSDGTPPQTSTDADAGAAVLAARQGKRPRSGENSLFGLARIPREYRRGRRVTISPSASCSGAYRPPLVSV